MDHIRHYLTSQHRRYNPKVVSSNLTPATIFV